MNHQTPTPVIIPRLAPYVLVLCAFITIYVAAVVTPGKSDEAAEWLRLAGGWLVPSAIVLLLNLPAAMESRDGGVWVIVTTVFSGAVLGLLIIFLAATFVLW